MAAASAHSEEPPPALPLLLGNRFHPELMPLLAARLRTEYATYPESVPAAVAAATTTILLHGHVAVNAALLARFPRLRVLSNHGVGIDHIDVAACTRAGVLVCHTPGVLTDTVADMALALLLAAARDIVSGAALATAPSTTELPKWSFGTEVSGAVVGIVGFGRIGQAIARRCACGFGMRVLYHCRHRLTSADEAGLPHAVEYHASLASLLPRCDFVVLALPGSPDVTGLVGAAQLALMQRHAILVNIGRGNAVDAGALAAALADGGIRGAALDVTEPEPLPRDHPLLVQAAAGRCIITPHTGSATMKTRAAMLGLVIDNAEAAAACAGDGGGADERSWDASVAAIPACVNSSEVGRVRRAAAATEPTAAAADAGGGSA